jgi:hypothetical protein
MNTLKGAETMDAPYAPTYESKIVNFKQIVTAQSRVQLNMRNEPDGGEDSAFTKRGLEIG